MIDPKRHLLWLVLVSPFILPGELHAAPNVKNQPGGAKIWYRYYNEKGTPTLSDQVTEEHVRRGYDVLDRNMQVTKRVPAFNQDNYYREKARREAAMVRQQEDQRILRLYSTAKDAEHARNRQLDTLENSIGYNRLQLSRLKRLRDEQVEMAAEAERAGKPLTKKQKDDIARFDAQINDLNVLVQNQLQEQQKVTNDFVPIIKRLTEIESGRSALPGGPDLNPSNP